MVCIALSPACRKPVAPASEPVVAVFGDLYKAGSPALESLKTAGYDTFVIWAIHVHDDGDLFLHDDRIVTGGRYVGRPEWPDELAGLRRGRTSIRRLELSVGGWGTGDFRSIAQILRDGGMRARVLRENFAVLKRVTGAEAVDLNDEDFYDLEGMVAFGEMLIDLGFKVTLCPFVRESYWRALAERLGPAVDRVYLICYDGGRLNAPAPWARIFGRPIIAGLKADDFTPGRMQVQLGRWRQEEGFGGVFVWRLDEMVAASPDRPAAYASAIRRAIGLREAEGSRNGLTAVH